MIAKSDAAHKTRILVIEDDFFAAKVATIIFEEKDCIVDCVSTGKDALTKEIYCYDLILLDIGLPDLNGFEVAKLIRKNYKIPPIVMLTAHEDEGNIALAKKLDINGFFIKPLTKAIGDLLLSQFVCG